MRQLYFYRFIITFILCGANFAATIVMALASEWFGLVTLFAAIWAFKLGTQQLNRSILIEQLSAIHQGK